MDGRGKTMKSLRVLALGALFVSTGALASEGAVPEFFFQPEENQTAVEYGAGYADSTDSDLNADHTNLRLSAMRGITHGLALRVGTSYTYTDDANGGDGFNNLNLDLVGHRALMGMNLHYGVLGQITPSKTGGDQRFGTSHNFTPYVGLSMGSEALMYGARVTHNSVSTTSPVFGDNYTGSLFAECHKSEKYLAGFAVDYLQTASIDDAVNLNLYGRMYFSKFTLLPRLNYTMQMEDGFEDSYGVEIAARMMF